MNIHSLHGENVCLYRPGIGKPQHIESICTWIISSITKLVYLPLNKENKGKFDNQILRHKGGNCISKINLLPPLNENLKQQVRKSFEVGGHWLLWRGRKNEWPCRTEKSRTLKKITFILIIKIGLYHVIFVICNLRTL